MEEKDEMLAVPYIVYEGTQARQERTIRRLITVIIVLISMLFATNAIWLYTWNSYEYDDVSYDDVDLDAGNGNANFIGRDIINGEIDNGENQDRPLQAEDQN